MEAFSIRAEGGVCVVDRDQIRHALALLIAPGDRHELRALPSARSRTIDGNDPDGATEIAASLGDEQVYYSLNPIRPDAPRANKKTVTHRRWFLIDVDTIRPKDVSASDDEKARCGSVANAILGHLIDLEWPAPLMIDSGNGWHLLYRIDLPNTTLSQQILKAAVYALAERFNDEHAEVDRATHDAPRISKLPGTLARKGPNTPDRPHRLASIVYEPDTLVPVTVEQIQALGKVETTEINGGGFHLRATDRPGKAGYVRSAILGECGRVALTNPGNRNNALNVAAFSLGTMADWPEMGEAEARAALVQTARQVGLDERETLLTIASGWNAGKAEPRKRDETFKANGVHPKPEAPSRLVIRASEIRPKRVDWLWSNRIAIGFITIFAGRTGVGKSFVLCDFISRLTTGRALPDAQSGRPPSNVLMISEDPYEYVLAPRLKEMNADLDRVSFLTWEAMAAYTLADVGMLDRAYEEADQPLLVAIDPPANFLGGKADEHKNSEVRQILMGIVAWLNSKSVACVMITHVNKQVGKGVEAVDRIMGSVAWASTSRVALGFAPDPKDQSRCLFAGIKNNLGPKAITLAYSINPTDNLAVVGWQGAVDTTANEAFENAAKTSIAESIEAWMEERFREKRVWIANDLKEYAIVSGFSFNAYKTYKKGVRKKQVPDENGGGTWVWEALHGWPPPIPETSESPESAESAPLSTSHVTPSSDSGKQSPTRISRMSVQETTDSAGSADSADSSGGSGTESAPPWDSDLGFPGERLERRRFKIGTWIRNLLWGNPAPGQYVLQAARNAGFEEADIHEVARLIGVDTTGENWVYRGF